MNEGLIIIPAYNEEGNISNVLRDIIKLNIPIDIVVINDGSKDKTKEKAEETGVKVISHLYNLGYGAALQTGFKYAATKNYKYVIQFDGDGQHDPEDLKTAISIIEKGDAYIVTGSRFLVKNEFKAGALKIIVIKFLRGIIKLSTGVKITDPTSGFKALSKSTYTFYSKGSNFPSDYPDADIIIKMLRLKLKMVEFPINVRQRVIGESMHSGLKPIIYMFKVMLSIIAVLLREKLLKEDSINE